MNAKPLATPLILSFCLSCLAQVETSIQPVALSGRPAPGLVTNITLNNFYDFSIANDGRVAFTATLTGSGVTTTNNFGVWANLSSDFQLLARTGDPVPDTNGGYFTWFDPTITDAQTVAVGARTSEASTNATSPTDVDRYMDFKIFANHLATYLYAFNLAAKRNDFADQILTSWDDDPAMRVHLEGPGIGPTNDEAILAGPATNLLLVARTSSPAPGSSGNYTSISDDARAMALAPDGRVAFEATADGTSGLFGLWFGNATTLQTAMIPGKPAPVSLLGTGYSFNILGDTIEVNGTGQLAFSTSLTGPGLNNTNSQFTVAGAPGALRVIAQSGQPAPGIPGAFFRSYFSGGPVFTDELIGEDGAVAFAASYGTNGYDFGLWLAPSNGATPILLMRTGAQAPGAPPGIYFTNSFQYLPPFEEVFMNGQNEVVFRSYLAGPGSDTNLLRNIGIFLAEPEGTVNLVVRSGQMIDIGGGKLRELQNVTFGDNPPSLGGPADGRPRLINNSRQILFWATWQNPLGPPDFGSYGQGLFIAQIGLILSAMRSGTDVVLSFPTVAGKHYCVDYKTQLLAPSWATLVASVAGTGSTASLTNTPHGTMFYRAVRTD
jgi:hypothetical protein